MLGESGPAAAGAGAAAAAGAGVEKVFLRGYISLIFMPLCAPLGWSLSLSLSLRLRLSMRPHS